jgi:hypothetical protein
MPSLAENCVRHIYTLRETEAQKRDYQIRCSHYQLELACLQRKTHNMRDIYAARGGPMCRTGLF